MKVVNAVQVREGVLIDLLAYLQDSGREVLDKDGMVKSWVLV